MRAIPFLVLGLVFVLAGCEDPAAQRLQTPPQATSAAPSAEATVGQPAPTADNPSPAPSGAAAYDPAALPAVGAPAQGAPAAPANPYAAPGDAPAAPTDTAAAGAPTGTPSYREKAEAGVGEKGQNLPQGIYTTPAKAYFQTRERLAFIQVEQAIQLYRGVEGRLPKSHEEFMEKVIQANGIQLPELAPDSRYVWDAEKGELMVERQRQQ